MKISIAQIKGSVLLTDHLQRKDYFALKWIELYWSNKSWIELYVSNKPFPFQFHFVVTLMICKDIFGQRAFLLYCDGVILPAENVNIISCLCDQWPWLKGFHWRHRISILLDSGLNPAWHFWLSTIFSCCLKMKSVENILGYFLEQFKIFSRGLQPLENL